MPNFDRLFSMYTKDHIANFSIFQGRPDITVWPRTEEKSKPVIKVIFNNLSLMQFKQILKKAVNDPENFRPVELGMYPWDRELKQPKFRSAITVGRDSENCIYFEIKGENHKEPIRFYPADMAGYRLNDQEPPKQHLTEVATNALLDQIDYVFQAGTYLTKSGNNDTAPEPSAPSGPPPASGDDVPF